MSTLATNLEQEIHTKVDSALDLIRAECAIFVHDL
jgi:hypothetical protein